MQRIIGEESLPASGYEFIDAARWMLRNALQDIDKIDVRMDVVESAGSEQTLDDFTA